MKKNLLLPFLFLFTLQLFAADYYWVGGGGNWSDLNNWRLGSSTGSIPSIVPSASDNVIFGSDAGFTNASRTVVINSSAFCNNMVWETGVPNNPILSGSTANKINIYGNLTLAPTVSYSSIGINFLGTSNSVLTTNGTIAGTMSLTLNKPNGGLTLADDLVYSALNNSSNTLDITEGHFNAQDRKLGLYTLLSNNNNTRILDFTNAVLDVSLIVDIRGLNKTVNATGSVITSVRFYVDGGTYHTVDLGTGTSTYLAINNTTFGKLTFTNISGTSGARIHSNNVVDSLFFKGSGTIRNNNNTVGYAVFDGLATIGGSGNQIGYAEMHDALNIIEQGNNTFDTLITAPNKNTQISGTNTINQYFRAGSLPCDGFTEISGINNGTLNFATGSNADMDNVLLSNLTATGANTPITVNGIDNDGNSGFTFIEPTGTGQTLYWVGGAGDWNDKAHWSTSSGGSGGACIPFTNDNVVFDGGSGFSGGNNTVTTSGNSYCKDMTWAAGISGTPVFTAHANFMLRVYGSVVLNPTVTMNATLNLLGTNSVTLTTNGSTLGVNRYVIHKSDPGATSGLTLTDNWNNTLGRFDLVRGVLDLNNRTLNIAEYVSSGNLGRNLLIENADINIYNWSYIGSNHLINANNSKIIVTNKILTRSSDYNYVECTYGGTQNNYDIANTTFKQLTFSNPALMSSAAIGSGNTIERLEFKGRGTIANGGNAIDSLLTAENRNFYFSNGTNTINKYFKATHPSCTGLGEIRTNGSTSTLVFGANAQVDISNVYMENIAATGGGGTLVLPIPFNGADAGGNSGWSITSDAGNARYWVGGGGDWNDASHWSTTSGGPGGACIPTVSDDVYFDENSGFGTSATTRTVTINNGNAYSQNMDWTGATNDPIFAKGSLFDLEIWGNLVMNPVVTMNTNVQLLFVGSANTTITTNGSNLGDFDFKIKKSTQTAIVKVLDDISNPLTRIELERGGLDLSDRIVKIEGISDNGIAFPTSINISNAKLELAWSYTGSQKSLLASGSEITASYFFANAGVYNKVDVITPTSNRVDISNSTFSELLFSNPASPAIPVQIGANNTIGRLEFKGRGMIGGTGNSIETLIFAPGKIYSFLAGSTTTITNGWFGSGTPCSLTEILSTGTPATVNKASGSVDFDYVRLSGITATGGADFSVGTHSTDLGGNTGWDIAPYNGASPILGLGADLTLNLSQFPYTLDTSGFFGSPLSQYVWSKDGNGIGTGDELVITEPGMYKVDVTFPDGCTVSDEITVSLEEADLAIVKTVDISTPDVGSEVVFQLVVSNEGPGEGNEIVVEDLLPAGYTYVSHTAPNGTNYDPATGIWTVGTLINGASSTLTITTTVNATGPYKNTATVSAAEVDPVPGNNSSSVTPTPFRVQIYKVGPITGNAGTEITYALEVTNTGTGDTPLLLIEDLVPNELTNVSWATSVLGSASVTSGATGTGNTVNVTGEIPAGSANQITVTIKGTIPASTSASSFSNIAIASANGKQVAISNEVETSITKQVGLHIQKNGPSTVVAGSEVVYMLEVTNSGPSDAQEVSITDTIPAGLGNVIWTAAGQNGATVDTAIGTNNVSLKADIPSGTAKVLITITGTLDPNYTATSLVNTASADPGPGVVSPTSATSTVTSAVSRVANLRITKSGPANIAAGEPIRYTLRVVNDGPSNATGVAIKDELPSGILNATWTATAINGAIINGNASGIGDIDLTGDFSSGGIIEIEILGIVSPALINGTDFMNTATVNLPAGSLVTDPDPATNTSSITTIVNNTPDFTVSKSGPGTANIGDPIQYTIVIRNSGSGNITGALIKDEVPTSITVTEWNIVGSGGATVDRSSGITNSIESIGDLPIGGSITLNVSGTVNSSATTAITNRVEVTAGNVLSSDVTTTVNQSTDIVVEKSGPQSAVAGLPITYTIKVSNAGSVNAKNVSIQDNIPLDIGSISWNAITVGSAVITTSNSGNTNSLLVNGEIDAGADNYILININGIVGANANATIVNTATATLSGLADFHLTNNTSTVETTITKETDLAITKTVNSHNPLVGSNVVFTLVATNRGPSTATSVNVIDMLPSGYTFVSATPGIGTYAPATGTWMIGTLGNGISTTLTITASVNAVGPYENRATISGLEADPDGANNIASVITTPIPIAHLTIQKTVKNPGQVHFVPGEEVVYTIHVKNDGPSAAESVNIQDIAPVGTQISQWAAVPSGTVVYPNTSGTGDLNETIAVLENGETAVYEVVVKTPSDFITALVNTVSVTSDTNDPDPTCPACTTNPLTADMRPQLELWKTGSYLDLNGNGKVDVGDVVNYSFTVRNTGNVRLAGIQVTDPMVPVIGGPVTLEAGVVDDTTFTAVYTIVQADIDQGSIHNQATAAGIDLLGKVLSVNSIDPTSQDLTNPMTITLLTGVSQIGLVKTVVNTGTGQDGRFLVGDEIHYQFVTTNTGTKSLTDITLDDPMISNSSIFLANELLPGNSVTHTASYIVTSTDADLGYVLNQALVMAEDPDGNLLNTPSGTAIGNQDPTRTEVYALPTTSDVLPVANDDRSEVEVDQTVIILVVDNDQPGSFNLDLASLEIVNGPSHGRLITNTDGTFSYTSEGGYIGEDTFIYRIQDMNGNWSNTATVTITIYTPDLIIPNVFTPNGDGKNDTFAIQGLQGYEQMELTIFNRWGNEVYRSQDYKNNWEGGNLTEGTYYYLLTLKKEGKESVHKGWVMLKK